MFIWRLHYTLIPPALSLSHERCLKHWNGFGNFSLAFVDFHFSFSLARAFKESFLSMRAREAFIPSPSLIHMFFFYILFIKRDTENEAEWRSVRWRLSRAPIRWNDMWCVLGMYKLYIARLPSWLWVWKVFSLFLSAVWNMCRLRRKAGKLSAGARSSTFHPSIIKQNDDERGVLWQRKEKS